MIRLLQSDQQEHTLRQDYSNVLMRNTVHDSALLAHHQGGTIVLYYCTLPVDGPLRAETCRSLRIKTLL